MGYNMLAVNHEWQINKYAYKEIVNVVGTFGDYFHLIKNKVEYRIPISCIIYLVPNNKYFIRMNSINKLMERVKNGVRHD